MRRIPTVLAALPVAALVLSGCGSGDAAGGGEGGLTVVTSTNVYASIVSSIAGDAVTVDPIIEDPAQDPHDYEATSRDQLILSRADLVVMNGGGYDSFVTTMLNALDHEPVVVDAVGVSSLPGAAEAAQSGNSHDHSHEEDEAHDDHAHEDEGHDTHAHEGEAGQDHGHEGHDHDHGSFNEHVWYSVPTMIALVDEVEHQLAEIAPDDAAVFEENAAALHGELEALHERVEEMAQAHSGEQAALTEPVALWLFEDLGLENVIPAEFVAAVESGSDVSPLVRAQATKALEDKDVAVFAYNAQTFGPEAEALREEAAKRDIPVIEVTETIPEDGDYVTWMTATVDELDAALA